MEKTTRPWLCFDDGPSYRRGPWRLLIEKKWIGTREVKEQYGVGKSTMQKRIYKALQNPDFPLTPEQMVQRDVLVIPPPLQEITKTPPTSSIKTMEAVPAVQVCAVVTPNYLNAVLTKIL